jgi:hypothetical protein
MKLESTLKQVLDNLFMYVDSGIANNLQKLVDRELALKDTEISELKEKIRQWALAGNPHAVCPCGECKALLNIAEGKS